MKMLNNSPNSRTNSAHSHAFATQLAGVYAHCDDDANNETMAFGVLYALQRDNAKNGIITHSEVWQSKAALRNESSREKRQENPQ